MESMQDRLNKLREERLVREKARLEKLREINLKKYNKGDIQAVKSTSQVDRSSSAPNRIDNGLKAKKSVPPSSRNAASGDNKLPVNINKHDSRPLNNTKPKPNGVKDNGGKNTAAARPVDQIKARPSHNIAAVRNNVNAVNNNVSGVTNNVAAIKNNVSGVTINATAVKNNVKNYVKSNAADIKQISHNRICDNKSKLLNGTDSRKSFVPLMSASSRMSTAAFAKPTKVAETRKSILPKPKVDIEPKSRESVFDRLYKPKVIPKITVDNATKLKTDPNYLKQVMRDSNLIINKRHTVFENKEKPTLPVRRSISAVHFKRISKNELSNCIHKWASIGEKINKVHLNEVSEDDSIKEEKVVSAVKSERKRVKFQTPISSNFNTPKPRELQERLLKWLQKRGKAPDSYHHLQCFGLHHLPQSVPSVSSKLNLCDEEDKENIALEHDSDNESYTENVSNRVPELNVELKNPALDKWRRASMVSDSIGFNDSCETTLTSAEELHQVDELLLGALNDLTELLREGFDWEQCARWLRAIRERFPEAPEGAAYWECRAALEERRGDLSASVQCWERAIANGTEQSVVEANLDQLLDKFMQLKISPRAPGRAARAADPKMLDVRNVFKSTIIRFAVRQAKLSDCRRQLY